MKVLKDFTEKGSTKRWYVGETYTGSRGKELAAKGLIDGGKIAIGKPLPDLPIEEAEKVEWKEVKEKVEKKPTYEKNVVATISTQKVKKGK